MKAARKKLFVCILSIALTITMMPINVIATLAEETDTPAVTETVETPAPAETPDKAAPAEVEPADDPAPAPAAEPAPEVAPDPDDDPAPADVAEEPGEPSDGSADGDVVAGDDAGEPGGEPADGGAVVGDDDGTDTTPADGEPSDDEVSGAKNPDTEDPDAAVDGEKGEDEPEEPSREVETWIVTFYNRDAEEHVVVNVSKGEAIGDQFPDTIEREDYDAYWAIGEIVQGGQGQEIHVLGPRIDATYVPSADIVVVPDYAKIECTVEFYEKETDTEPYTTKTVTADTTYCLNDVPAVPAVEGSLGKWVYSGGDFTNNVNVKNVSGESRTLKVWPEYEQNVFDVTFLVDGSNYASDEYNKGETLELPADPVVEGKDFVGWFVGEDEYEGGEPVTSDLTISARFTEQYKVEFVILNDDGTVSEKLSQYYRSTGEPIGTMPQNPFVAGKVFEKWVVQGTETEVTADTRVTGNMTVVAVFRTVTIYNITTEYYYESTTTPGKEVVFNTDLLQAEEHELPYTITAPDSTKTDPDEVAGAPIYYPETPQVVVKKSDFNDDKECTVRIKYVPFTAIYDFVYYLKDLDGNGYTEIERVQDVEGVLNSYVTPTVKTYDYAVLELAEGAIIETTGLDGEPKQELPVYYNRKNFQLTYETNGGTYVAGSTVPYGTTVNLPSNNPTRQGYTFAGWYSDAALTQQVTGSVTVNADTTLYAKWTGNTVGYSIVYMKEQYDNSTGTTSYVYENSGNGTGEVGTTVTAASAPGISLNGYQRSTDTTYEGASVTIAADGSSVLVVRYDLIRYTLIFNLNRDTGRITMDGQTYSGSNYRIENVVLGQDVSSMWPATASEVYASDRYFDGWTGAGSTYITKRYELVWDNVSRANSDHEMTFTATWSTSSANRNAEYWLQQPDGTYAVADEYTQIGLNTTNLSAKDIDGYSKHNGTPSGYSGSGNTATQVWVDEHDEVVENYGSNTNYSVGQTITYNGNTYTITAKRNGGRWDWYDYYYTLSRHVEGHYETQQIYTYRFYYDRAQYTITYKDGGTTLRTTDSIYFEADISGATYNYTPNKPAGKEDYTWGGWYADSGLQNIFVFDKMPGNNVVVYAKWIAPTFTVNFVDQDGTTQLADSQTVTKNNKVDKPTNPTKAGYTFDGWYTSASGDTLFDWNTQITADTTVYAHWTRNTLGYTVHYVTVKDGVTQPVADDKIVTNPNFTVGQTIEESAIAIAGYRPDESSKTLVLAESGNEITFYYSEKSNTTSYTVRYVIADGETGAGTVVAEGKTVENVPGDTASVIELAKAVDYDTLYAAKPELQGIEFYPDEVEKTLVLTANAETNVLTFYYSSFKNAKITVNFVDMDGNPIANPDTQIKKVGNNYTLARTPIAGWELDKAVVGTSYSGDEAGSDYKITNEVANAGGLTFTLFYRKKVTITAKSATKQYDGTALTLPGDLDGQVTVEGLPDGEHLTSIGLTYTKTDNDTNDGRINAGVATVTPKNAQTNGAHTASNYYVFRYISGTLEVTKINVTIRIEPDRWTGNVYDGTFKKTGFTNGSKGIDDYVMISHDGYKRQYRDVIWGMVTHLDNVTYDASTPGLHYYVLSQKDVFDEEYELDLDSEDMPDGGGNYSVSLYVRPGRLQILPKEITVTTASDTKPYDGTPLTKTDEYIVEGIVSGETYGFEVTGSQTEVGSSKNNYTITWGGEGNTYTALEGNYTVSDTLGTLEVTQATLRITINGKSSTYDGSAQNGYAAPASVTGTGSKIETDEYVIEGLANGQVLTISGYIPSTGTNVGTYNNGSFTNATITVKSGETDVTGYYYVTTTAGPLTIKKRPVTFTGETATKEYTGSEIELTGVTPSEGEDEGLVSGHTDNV
ncbi:MAG: InlB B-repeat-containing protein, partial [Mogibacterium sp.]|nr:InlB B-repeat-containing protein [Mogibacterium sp.]